MAFHQSRNLSSVKLAIHKFRLQDESPILTIQMASPNQNPMHNRDLVIRTILAACMTILGFGMSSESTNWCYNMRTS